MAIALGTPSTNQLYRWGRPPDERTLTCLLADAPEEKQRLGVEAGSRACRVVPLIADGMAVGILATGPKRHDVEPSPEDDAPLATLAPMVATALQNALLLRQLEQQVATLAQRERAFANLSDQLLRAQEEERRRIALDLHDDALARVALLLRDLDRVPPHPQLQRCRQAAEEIGIALRATCMGLRPSVVDDLGVAAGLVRLVGDARARADATVTFEVETPDGVPFGRFDPDLETALYRVAQEALHNCLQHAHATEIAVLLRRDGQCAHMEVADNGRGFAASQHDATIEQCLGLMGMEARLRPWGGRMVVANGPRGGTVVSVDVPLRR